MPKAKELVEGVKTIKRAIAVREEISAIYADYNSLCLAVTSATRDVQRGDLKRAIDALYYFGGGWPSVNSKGRMEALLENFVGMYRILDFIDEGHRVVEHLAKFGVSVKLADEFKITNYEFEANDMRELARSFVIPAATETPKDLKELMTVVVLSCLDFQSLICKLADEIKDQLRPAAVALLEVQDEEYDRLHAIVKLSVKDTARSEEKARDKKIGIHGSVKNFNTALGFTKE